MIEVKNIYCGYDNKEIIKNLSFKVNNGENLCIVGPNGCGKSTLLKSIANIIEYRGNVKIDDKEVNNFSRVDLAKKVALMSQMSQVYFPYTVYDTVSLGRYAYSKGAFSKLSKLAKILSSFGFFSNIIRYRFLQNQAFSPDKNMNPKIHLMNLSSSSPYLIDV